MMSFAAHMGVIASREHRPQFFTSNLYPVMVEDAMEIDGASVSRGIVMSSPDDQLNVDMGILGGTLTTTIAYPSYTPPNPEDFTITNMAVLAGTLTTTIAYKLYDAPQVDEFELSNVNILGGTLTTTVHYVNYEGRTEDFTIASFGINGGTLA